MELLDLYRQEFRKDIICYEPLTAHGSDREIVRLGDNNGNTAIGIFNDNVSENRAFIEFDLHFKKHGINVPFIFRISDDLRFYLMEDLGDTTLLVKIKEGPGKQFGEKETELYKKALSVLPEFQIKAGPMLDFGLCYQFDEFGGPNIVHDMNYFKERFLLNFYNGEIDFERLDEELGYLKARALEMGREFFLYRDFQSRNIMIKGDELFFIDFQSGRKGSLLYDLASLLYDAKAKVPQEIRESLIDYYINEIGKYRVFDKETLKLYFWYFAVIRILQALGAYGFLGIVKGRSKFLESVPYALANINVILNEKVKDPEVNYLRTIFRQLLNEKT